MLKTNTKWMDAIMYDSDDDKDDEKGADDDHDHDHDNDHEIHDDHDNINILIYDIKSHVCVRACIYIYICCAIMRIQFTCV